MPLAMRTLFVAYAVLITSGIVYYAIVGLTHS
jgi:hypothetical protein